MAALARWAMQFVQSVGSNTLKAAAPNGMRFEDSRRRVVRSNTSVVQMSMPWDKLVLSILAVMGWIWSLLKEKRARSSAALASSTPYTSLADLQLALRGPGVLPAAAPATGPWPAQEVPHEVAPETVNVSVCNITGRIIWGPQTVRGTNQVADIKHEAAETLGIPHYSLRLLHGTQELESTLSLSLARIPDGAVLTAVVSNQRIDVADSLYAKAAGNIWAPHNQLVRTPFSQQSVVYFEALTVRLYDVWVTRYERRKVKTRRAATTDDNGSDSEYEEVNVSGWESSEEVQNRQIAISPRIYVDDGSGHRAVISPPDAQQWARQNSVQVFSDTQTQGLGLGVALQAVVANERERGTRREERCIRVGEAVEVIAEVRATEDGLVLQEPNGPSDQLHRVNSDSFLAPSPLTGKTFVASVLRQRTSLEDVVLRTALKWRVGKWLFGGVLVWLTLLLIRHARRMRRVKLGLERIRVLQ